MPKAKTTKKSAQSGASDLIVLTHDDKRVLVLRPTSHVQAIETTIRHFPCMKRDQIVFQTKELEICNDEYIDIGQETWEVSMPLLSALRVIQAPFREPEPKREPATACTFITSKAQARRLQHPFSSSPGHPNLSDEHPRINVTFEYRGKSLQFTARRNTRCGTLLRHIGEITDYASEDELKVSYKGFLIAREETLSTLGFESGDTIDVFPQQIGGNPWKLSTIYPVVPIKQLPISPGEIISWNVKTHSDGTLTETTNGLDVSYLFWEAETNFSAPMSPPQSPALGSPSLETFSPLSSDLGPANSVLLSVKTLTPYLDRVLKALGLHIEARTSFITYWLPSFLKHTSIALRFLPQLSYARAAPLSVSPTPDVVTRVFMLFKGVGEDDVSLWSDAVGDQDDMKRWKDVIGVNVEKTIDGSLFRVIEWGGMEVLGR